MQGRSLEDHTFKGVTSSHCLEHYSEQDLLNVIFEKNDSVTTKLKSLVTESSCYDEYKIKCAIYNIPECFTVSSDEFANGDVFPRSMVDKAVKNMFKKKKRFGLW